MADHVGLLFIGDPHLASRAPGFRRDDYPATILEKLRWAMDYAQQHRLRPVLLGDLFEFPRDNANWLIVRLLPFLEDQTLAVYGNHDCKENALDENDTLSILVHANKIRLLDEKSMWRGVINGQSVVIGGTAWGKELPKAVEIDRLEPELLFGTTPEGTQKCPPHHDDENRPIVFWVTHHDIQFPDSDEFAHFAPHEIAGVDFVINGHIHRDLGELQVGRTLWINPGNISRLRRNDVIRAHVPGVLRADISAGGCQWTRVAVPHAPFDDVFHPEAENQQAVDAGSIFIKALADFESVRTASGAGLRHFLNENLPQFEPAVAKEINSLAEEVLQYAE
jgi:predicted phosphodiesterase